MDKETGGVGVWPCVLSVSVTDELVAFDLTSCSPWRLQDPGEASSVTVKFPSYFLSTLLWDNTGVCQSIGVPVALLRLHWNNIFMIRVSEDGSQGEGRWLCGLAQEWTAQKTGKQTVMDRWASQGCSAARLAVKWKAAAEDSEWHLGTKV